MLSFRITGAAPALLVGLLGLTAGAGGLVAAEKDAIPAVDDKWQRYESPAFELFSRVSDAEARELLHRLERLRAVFAERFHLVERVRLEVTVYAFRTLEDFRAYSPVASRQSEFFRGFYSAWPDRAVIIVAPMKDWEAAQRLIFHEYVHHLFRTTGESPPLWFNEGMADLLATIQEEGGQLEIGRPHVSRLRALREEKMLPLETLFAVDRQSSVYRAGQHTGVFYAQSWALLHYFYFGDSGLSRDQVDRFLGVVRRPKPVGAAQLRASFQECFGLDYAEMQKRLERYVQTGSYRFVRHAAPKVEAAKTYAVRAIPREEIRVRLAELALRVDRAGPGKFVLLGAMERNPADARIFEVLGAEALADGNPAMARERWEKALEAGSRNPAIHRELGLMESRTWFRQFDYYFRLPADLADRLRRRLLQSIDDAPGQSASYEMLAWVEAYAPEPVVENVKRVQESFTTLRERDRTLIALAMVRVRVDQREAALKLLDELDKLEPDTWSEHAAEVIRARIEGRPVRRSVGPRPANSGPGGGAPPRPPLAAPAIELPPRR